MSYSGASATSVQASGTTGGTCQVTGPYKCSSHGSIVIFFKRGQKFTACPSANSSSGHNATWVMVQG